MQDNLCQFFFFSDNDFAYGFDANLGQCLLCPLGGAAVCLADVT